MEQELSLRKIPFLKDISAETDYPDNTDNVKILELSNIIDEWEKEILFSDNGFYTLKGKNVENKTKEFIKNLDNLINSKISKMVFKDVNSRQEAMIIKTAKINAIKTQMEMYEKKQIKEWELEVYENSLNSVKTRAVLYRYNPEIVSESYKKGINLIKTMSDFEKWNKKILENKICSFESDFYFSIIKEFIKDKNINASIYYERYKNKLNIEDKEKTDKSINILKDNVIAYNWAKELYSYNLSDKENEREISQINNKEIQTQVKHFINEFKEEQKEYKKQEEIRRNEENWIEIVSLLQTEPNKAILYIDTTLSKESQKNKLEYINKMKRFKHIKTDKSLFMEVIKEIYEDIEKFKKKDISDYRAVFSEEDYKIIEEFKNTSDKEYNLFISDYEYISKVFSENSITDINTIYGFVKYAVSLSDNYKEVNKKTPDAEARNKIIKTALERYNEKGKK